MIRFKPHLVPTLIVVPSVALMLALSWWQMERLHWKDELIANAAARLHAAPVPLDEAVSGGLGDAEWRIVSVRGRFLHDKEVYLYAPSRDGGGVHVITPLQRDVGDAVLIDRGFVPDAKKDPATRTQGQVAGEVSVEGVLRLSQAPGSFTPQADQAKRLWFTRDVESIARAQGVAVHSYFIEANDAPNPGGFPVGGQTRTEFPNNHLQYALTWAALALTLISIYFIYHIRQRRLRVE